MFPDDLFNNVNIEIVRLLKSLDNPNFPAISTFLFKHTIFYFDYISNFILDFVIDDKHQKKSKSALSASNY